MMAVEQEPIPEMLKRMRDLDHEGRHEEANELREEIMERLRASVGRGGVSMPGLTDEIMQELQQDSSKIDNIQYGKVIIYIQDGKLVRIEVTEGRQIA
ncbi:DUF2292 domain-containing protein [Candidatus Darwinibacter acetoxidans]|jgi:hypothetical protein